MRSTVAVLGVLTAAAAAAQVEIQVHLYNRVNLSQSLLARATAATNRVFASTAITLRWQVCAPACVEQHPEIPVFIVGIAGPQMEMPTKAALGFAMLGAGPSNRAVVSIPRIEEFAESNGTSTAVALGHAMAHELGHLIARSSSHSSGIMTASWGNAGAARMRQGNLRFAAGDVDAMQKNLKASNR